MDTKNITTKQEGGSFRSEVSLTDAQEHVSRLVCGLPKLMTLDIKRDNSSLEAIKAIFGDK